jgi:mono/diheme cytochrome c family protein
MRIFSSAKAHGPSWKLTWLAVILAWPVLARADEAAERGRYLAILGDCRGCHTAPHKPAFSGGLPFTAAFGTLYSTNITPDRQTGIGAWSNEDFYHALHQGIAPGGRHLYPAFPYIYFARLDRQQSDDLFAYLKTLKPVHRPPSANALYFPFNIRAVMAVWNWLYLDSAPLRPDPKRSQAWNRGHFIVDGPGHCAACHTPKDLLYGDRKDRDLSGALEQNWFAANLTGNRDEGLGRWSREELALYLATGRNLHATAAGSMEEKVSLSTSLMRDEDRAAIATYLKSLPARAEAAPAPPAPAQMAAGEAVFVARCMFCHQPPGRADQPIPGPAADYPKLADDTLILARNPATVVRIILQGAQAPTTPNGRTTFAMPGFPVLSDAQLADVATYIRNSWGNRAAPVSARQVAAERHAIAVTPGY